MGIRTDRKGLWQRSLRRASVFFLQAPGLAFGQAGLGGIDGSPFQVAENNLGELISQP